MEKRSLARSLLHYSWAFALLGIFVASSFIILSGLPRATFAYSMPAAQQPIPAPVQGDPPACLQATFNRVYYTLTLVTGLGGSSTTGSGSYLPGSTVAITANALTGYSFLSWTGTGPGSYSGASNPATVTMKGPVTETATFNGLPESFSANAQVGGSVSCSGVGPSCSASYAYTSQETVNAMTSAGYVFSGWTCSPSSACNTLTSSPVAVTMPAGGVAITADFTPISYPFSANAGANGAVTCAVGGSSVPCTGGTEPFNTVVTVTGNPSTSYAISSWTCSPSSACNTLTSSPVAVKMPVNGVTVTGNFGYVCLGGGGVGCAVTTYGSNIIDTFTYTSTPGSTTWTAPNGITSVNILVVGGGGGGDSSASIYAGGGGGGGGVVIQNNRAVTPGVSYIVNVGAGGAGGSSGSSGSSGGASSFNNVVANGGGGGGATGGISGGSGGGTCSGAAGSATQGNSGGGTGYGGAGYSASCSSSGGGAAGGGGGAGGAATSEEGGPGIASAITGSTAYYAPGGDGAVITCQICDPQSGQWSFYGTCMNAQTGGALGGFECMVDGNSNGAYCYYGDDGYASTFCISGYTGTAYGAGGGGGAGYTYNCGYGSTSCSNNGGGDPSGGAGTPGIVIVSYV